MAKNTFVVEVTFKLIRPKKAYSSRTTFSEEYQIQEILTTCTRNVSRFGYFFQKLKIYLKNKIQSWLSQVQEWENITLENKIFKIIKSLPLDFEQDPPS